MRDLAYAPEFGLLGSIGSLGLIGSLGRFGILGLFGSLGILGRIFLLGFQTPSILATEVVRDGPPEHA